MEASKLVRKVPGRLKEKVRGFLAKQVHLPYVGFISVWIALFVAIPLGGILYFSFLTSGVFGRIVHSFTLENYRRLGSLGTRIVISRSLLFASVTIIGSLLLGYNLAYFIVRHGGRWKTLLLFLVILPSWTCYLIRLYALSTLISSAGLINSTLLNLGLISSPLEVLYTPFAVIFGLIYTWLPFMVLPIYASLEGLDPSLLEAAVDLGATPFRKFFTVTLPLTKGGIYAGVILVFIPSLGEWLVPLLLGGAKVMMIGSLVEHHFITVGNIPAGSAIAAALAAMVLLIIYLCIKLGGEEVLERTV